LWRIAAQEKVIPVIRRFKVESDGDPVSISELPTAMLRALTASRGEKH